MSVRRMRLILPVVWTLLSLVLFPLPVSGVAQAPADPVLVATRPGSIRGRIVGDGGRPVAGALVHVNFLNAGNYEDDRVSARSNREGEFEVMDVPWDVVDLRVEAPPQIVISGIPDAGVRAGAVLLIRVAMGAAITGKVVDENGNPLAGLRVEPEIVRDERGVRASSHDTEWEPKLRNAGNYTDDRGAYRLFGLHAGTYLVWAGGRTSNFERQVLFSDRLPTYYPSASRSAASEVAVQPGTEVTDIDIVLRSDPGHRISGSMVVAVVANPGWAKVELFRSREAVRFRYNDVRGHTGYPRFAFDDLEDGDYELHASSGVVCGEDPNAPALATPLKSVRVPVRVRGADVNGVKLMLQPEARIAATVEIGPGSTDVSCARFETGSVRSPVRMSDIFAGYREVVSNRQSPREADLHGDGTFSVRQMPGSRYRSAVHFNDEELFLVKVDIVPVTASRPCESADSPPAGANVAAEKQVDGLRFIVARGAARVRGRIAPAKTDEALPSRSRVCLVPADPKQKDDVVHYYEVDVERDGTFDVRNVAPGEYFVGTRVFPNDDRPDAEIFPASWDPKERAALRAAAEKLGIRLTLSPCQRLESAVITMTQM